MKRSALFAVVLILALGFASQSLAQSTPSTTRSVAAPTGSFAKLAEAVKPAVINVSTHTKSSGGSGVIIDPSGIALTNAHVVDGATTIEVVSVDGARHTAKVLGTDKKTDLAVLQLDGGTKTFPFVPLGNSDETQVGDWVIAIGSPFGLQATVTSGIVSAKARQIGAGPYDDFLQTDAAINPGNSGGPLVNMRGEVIGINTAILSGGSGIGFAIPSNMAKRVASELRTAGKVTRGWLGISLQPLTSDLASSFGVKDSKGALVSDVASDSPAARGGLKSGDVIVELNGKKVEDPSGLARAVGLARPGDTSRVKVWRDHQEKTVELKLGEMPAERTAAAGRTGGSTGSALGLTVQPVTPEIAQQLDLKHVTGVVVTLGGHPKPASHGHLKTGQ
jgi:serine protease Do